MDLTLASSRFSEADAPSLFGALLAGVEIPALIVDVVDGGRLLGVAVSDAAVRKRIVTTADVARRPASAFLRPESVLALTEGFLECLRASDRHQYEEFVEIDGRETWWLTTLVASLDAEGRPARLVVTFQPLDEVRRAERVLRRSESNLRGLVEASLDGVIVAQPSGRIVHANAAALEMLGLSEHADLQNANLRSHFGEEHRDELMGLVRARKQTDPRKETICTREGRELVAEIAMAPLSYHGKPVVLVMARDVTEAQVLRKQLALGEGLIALGTRAAGVAHEINNPLAYIHGNLAFVVDQLGRLRSNPDDESNLTEILDALADALEGTERVSRIVGDMKEQPSAHLADASIDVERALDTAIKMVHSQIEPSVTLTRERGDVPEVFASEPRLVQVFLNILLNAAQAMEQGAPLVKELHVATRMLGSKTIDVTFRDNGPGISDDHLPRLFEPFFTTKPIGTGTGLGLSISRRAVNQMGGRIWVESKVGVGTTFHVELSTTAHRNPSRRPPDENDR